MIPSCFKLYYNFYFEVIRKFDWYNTVGKSKFVVSKAFCRELFVGLAAKSHFADSHVHTWRKSGLTTKGCLSIVATEKKIFLPEPFLAEGKIELCPEYLQKHSEKRNSSHIL
jgi:hypothetical protein